MENPEGGVIEANEESVTMKAVADVRSANTDMRSTRLSNRGSPAHRAVKSPRIMQERDGGIGTEEEGSVTMKAMAGDPTTATDARIYQT